MKTSNPYPHNPFVLPGLGQSGEAASNPLFAGLEMMQQAWAQMTQAGGLAQAVPLDLEALERRITELRTVENWLKLNLSMLASSIQGLEVQRATIATLKSFVGQAPAPASAASAPAAGSTAGAADQAGAEQWWQLMQQQFQQLTQAASASMQEFAAGAQATMGQAAGAQSAASSSAKSSAKPAAKRAKPGVSSGTKPGTQKARKSAAPTRARVAAR